MSKDKPKTYEELCTPSTVRDPNTGKLVKSEAEFEKPAEPTKEK